MTKTSSSKKRAAARLAAVQALYQRQMEDTPITKLLDEFHQHRHGHEIDDLRYVSFDVAFFDEREAKFVNGVLDAVAKAVR